MRLEHIKQFLETLGVPNARQSGDNVVCSCPLARWTHQRGTDRRPSFSIKITEKGLSLYNCFACGFHGTLLNLLCRIATATGKTPHEAYEILEKYELDGDEEAQNAQQTNGNNLLGITLPYNGDDVLMKLKLKLKQQKIPPVPQEVLQKFPCISKHDRQILEWLMLERHISVEAIIVFRLRKFERDGKLGVIFPIIARSDKKTVLDMFVRLVDGKQNFRLTAEVVRRIHPELKQIPDYKATHLCFGNHLYDPEKPLVIVEAPLDAMRLYSLHFRNVVATCGALSTKQAEALYSRTVYLGFDADEAGRRFTTQAFKLLRKRIPVIYALDWNVASEQRQVKDANELMTMREAHFVFQQKKELQGVWATNGF